MVVVKFVVNSAAPAAKERSPALPPGPSIHKKLRNCKDSPPAPPLSGTCSGIDAGKRCVRPASRTRSERCGGAIPNCIVELWCRASKRARCCLLGYWWPAAAAVQGRTFKCEQPSHSKFRRANSDMYMYVQVTIIAQKLARWLLWLLHSR